MKIRIATDGNQFWLEGREFLSWKILPSISHYIHFFGIRYEVKYREFYKDYDKVRKEFEEYNRHFMKKNVSYIYPNERKD